MMKFIKVIGLAAFCLVITNITIRLAMVLWLSTFVFAFSTNEPVIEILFSLILVLSSVIITPLSLIFFLFPFISIIILILLITKILYIKIKKGVLNLEKHYILSYLGIIMLILYFPWTLFSYPPKILAFMPAVYIYGCAFNPNGCKNLEYTEVKKILGLNFSLDEYNLQKSKTMEDCKKINDLEKRKVCNKNIVEMTTTNPKECDQYYGKQDISLIGKELARCYARVVLRTHNIEICEQLRNFTYKDGLEESDLANYCLYSIVYYDSPYYGTNPYYNLDVCLKINHQIQANECYRLVAIFTKNRPVCDLIKNDEENYKDCIHRSKIRN